MNYIVRHAVVFISAVLVAVCPRAQTNTIHGYEFTTGVDTSLWADMSVSTPWGLLATDMATPLPFTFSIWNRNYDELVFYGDGTMLFRHQIRSNPSAFFPDSTQKLEPVAAGIFAYSRRRSYAITMLSTDINLDSVGHRIMVFEMTCDSMGITRRWQIRLSEEDNSITLLYDDAPGSGSYSAHIGLMLDTGHVIMVNPVSHTASATGAAPTTAWPGKGRYYRFTPTEELCATPAGLHIEQISSDGTGVQVSWRPSVFYTAYRVEYGEPGFAEGGGTTVTVADTTVSINNLTPDEDIEVRVHGVCTDSCSGYISMVVHLERVDTTEIHGYLFTSGVSSQLWYNMDNAVGWGGEYYSFPFPVFM
ncbi:MAG: fibronectin type III domain-containing protein, partial [Bacteroidales bacterium]|nr:fibronectin type III domain-containing protein [Bacteroidales bacterium]